MTKENRIESINDRIVLYLINYRKNRRILRNRPHCIFEDLAVVFQIADQNDPLRDRIVNYQDLDRWGIGIHDLYEHALENTPRLFPAYVETAKEEIGENDKEPVFIVSNHQGIYGAGVMLYPGFLKEFSQKYSWNLFLMPVSIHEVFVLLDRGQYVMDELHETAKRTASKCISQKDYLSDNLYYYDSMENQIFALY